MKRNLHIPSTLSMLTNTTHSNECRYIHKFVDTQVLGGILKNDFSSWPLIKWINYAN